MALDEPMLVSLGASIDLLPTCAEAARNSSSIGHIVQCGTYPTTHTVIWNSNYVPQPWFPRQISISSRRRTTSVPTMPPCLAVGGVPHYSPRCQDRSATHR